MSPFTCRLFAPPFHAWSFSCHLFMSQILCVVFFSFNLFTSQVLCLDLVSHFLHIFVFSLPYANAPPKGGA